MTAPHSQTSTHPEDAPSALDAAQERLVVGRGPRSRVGIALNLVGFALGLALLWWCGARALSPQNSEQLALLSRAPWWQAAALVGLSLATCVVNALLFRTSLTPVRRLPVSDVIAINFVASLGNYLPFKLGLLFRILTHRRRHGVPLLTIGAWMGAMGVLMLCVLAPVLGAGVWRGRVDALWWLTSAGGVAVSTLAVLVAARLMGTGRRWSGVERLWRALPMPRRLRDSPLLERLHEGTRMLGSPRAVVACIALRLTDLGLQAARFLVAAAIVGQALSWDQALLAGSTYYIIGSVSPSGQLGVREAGTAGLTSYVLAGVNFDAFNLLVLLVTAAELAAFLLGAAISLVFLARGRGRAPNRGAPC